MEESKQFSAKTVDFGASALGAVQIPEAIGSVAVAYNIPGIPTKTLKFTGPVLADIFQGKITKWNDPQIQALNPGVSLPAVHIVVVHRSDGSGTTYVWTSYLSDQEVTDAVISAPLGHQSQFHGQESMLFL